MDVGIYKESISIISYFNKMKICSFLQYSYQQLIFSRILIIGISTNGDTLTKLLREKKNITKEHMLLQRQLYRQVRRKVKENWQESD